MEQRIPKKRKPASPPAEDARIVRSRGKLHEALLRLMQKTPFEQITIRGVAAKAGVGYTTFFRLYDSKDALLHDVAAEEVARLCDLTAPIYDATQSQTACLALCVYIEERRALWRALLAGGAGFVREELRQQGVRLAAPRRAARGALPDDLSVTLATAVMFEVLAWWLRQKQPMSAAAVADILDRTAIAPAEARSPPRRAPKRAARRKA
jgi:AcrR family transcriptional regulator